MSLKARTSPTEFKDQVRKRPGVINWATSNYLPYHFINAAFPPIDIFHLIGRELEGTEISECHSISKIRLMIDFLFDVSYEKIICDPLDRT